MLGVKWERERKIFKFKYEMATGLIFGITFSKRASMGEGVFSNSCVKLQLKFQVVTCNSMRVTSSPDLKNIVSKKKMISMLQLSDASTIQWLAHGNISLHYSIE